MRGDNKFLLTWTPAFSVAQCCPFRGTGLLLPPGFEWNKCILVPQEWAAKHDGNTLGVPYFTKTVKQLARLNPFLVSHSSDSTSWHRLSSPTNHRRFLRSVQTPEGHRSHGVASGKHTGKRCVSLPFVMLLQPTAAQNQNDSTWWWQEDLGNGAAADPSVTVVENLHSWLHVWWL